MKIARAGPRFLAGSIFVLLLSASAWLGIARLGSSEVLQTVPTDWPRVRTPKPEPISAASSVASWTMYQRSPGHNAVFESAAPARHWVFQIGKKNNGALAILNGTIYIDDFQRNVWAIDAVTGNPRWKTTLDNIVMSSPIVAHGMVFVGTGMNGRLHGDDPRDERWGRPQGDSIVALDATTGSIRWRFHTIGEDMPSPAYVRGKLIFANGDEHAYALDARNGKLLWHIPMNGISTMASATPDGENVLLAACTIKPYACETVSVDSNSGTVRWRAPYGGSDCSPTVGDGRVFVSETQDQSPYQAGGVGIITALDSRTGAKLWQYRSQPGPYTSIGSSERTIAGTYVDGVYYQPVPMTTDIVAFDAQNGRALWSYDALAPVKMSPVVKDGRLYVGDTIGVFYIIDARDGKLLHSASFDQSFSTSPPIIYGNTLYVSAGTFLYAFPYRRGQY